ncbi:response regulator transcription factor [Anaerolineales bacterium]
MIRVFIADDHHLVRQGIKALLEKADDIEVVGEAENGEDAVNAIKEIQTDVLVIDVSMPKLNGIQAIEHIQNIPNPPSVVILSMYSDESLVRQAIQTGAVGYILKRSVTEELLLAVRAANERDIYLSPSIAPSIIEDLKNGAQSDKSGSVNALSPREMEVLKLVCEGKTNREIGEMMTISVKTVEKHRANLMAKLNVHDVAGLMRIALKNGIIFLE